MAVSKVQNFDIVTIHRSEIKNAPYNPRFISEGNKRRLKKGLKKFGLVETLVWNERTGNLVSGHQRLSQIDEIEGNQDYELTVSVVNLSETDEMALNVQLNNTSMMGEYDLDALAEMAEQGANIDDFGFSDSDIEILFGESDLVEKFIDSSEITETKDKLRDIKKDRSEYTEKMKEANNASFYFTVICESMEEREELFNKMGVPFSEEFINSEMLKRLAD